jgi:hypothetical protein
MTESHPTEGNTTSLDDALAAHREDRGQEFADETCETFHLTEQSSHLEEVVLWHKKTR